MAVRLIVGPTNLTVEPPPAVPKGLLIVVKEEVEKMLELVLETVATSAARVTAAVVVGLGIYDVGNHPFSTCGA